MKNYTRSNKLVFSFLVCVVFIFILFFVWKKNSMQATSQFTIDPSTVTGIYERGARDLLVIETKTIGTSTDTDLYIIDYDVPPPLFKTMSTPAGKLVGTRATDYFDAANCSAWYDFINSEMRISPSAASCMEEPNFTGIYTKITNISPEQAIEIVSNVPEVKKWLPQIKGNIDGMPIPYVESITRDSYTIVVPGKEHGGNVIGRAPIGPYVVNALTGKVAVVKSQ